MAMRAVRNVIPPKIEDYCNTRIPFVWNIFSRKCTVIEIWVYLPTFRENVIARFQGTFSGATYIYIIRGHILMKFYHAFKFVFGRATIIFYANWQAISALNRWRKKLITTWMTSFNLFFCVFLSMTFTWA